MEFLKFKNYNLIKESLKDHFEQMASMMDGNSKQKEFFEWEISIAKQVKVKPYYKNPELKEIVDEWLKTNDVKKRSCFHTAWKMSYYDKDIEYCEGFIPITKGTDIPIEHAWNVYKKKYYFDLISDVAWEGMRNFGSEYLMMFTLTISDLGKYSSKLGHSGPFLTAYYVDKILKQPIKKGLL